MHLGSDNANAWPGKLKVMGLIEICMARVVQESSRCIYAILNEGPPKVRAIESCALHLEALAKPIDVTAVDAIPNAQVRR